MEFLNPNRPFVIHHLSEFPEFYAEYKEALENENRMAIIEDDIYCDNKELIDNYYDAFRSLVKMQFKVGSPYDPWVFKPLQASYLASFIVQNGIIVKNHLSNE